MSEQPTDRREFLSQATLAAVAVVLAGCGGESGPSAPTPVNQEPPPGTGGGTLTVTVSAFAALANVGGIAAVGTLASKPVAVVRTGTSTFTALSRICTHAGCDVNVVGSGFTCPCHGSRFDATGVVTVGPAVIPLQRFNVAVSNNGGTLTIS